jgi:hypothetical protein
MTVQQTNVVMVRSSKVMGMISETVWHRRLHRRRTFTCTNFQSRHALAFMLLLKQIYSPQLRPVTPSHSAPFFQSFLHLRHSRLLPSIVIAHTCSFLKRLTVCKVPGAHHKCPSWQAPQVLPGRLLILSTRRLLQPKKTPSTQAIQFSCAMRNVMHANKVSEVKLSLLARVVCVYFLASVSKANWLG